MYLNLAEELVDTNTSNAQITSADRILRNPIAVDYFKKFLSTVHLSYSCVT